MRVVDVERNTNVRGMGFSILGSIYMNKGEYDQAIANFDEVLKLFPKLDSAYATRGLAYFYKGDYDRAIAGYNQAWKLNPTKDIFYENRGGVYFGKGDFDHAIADFDQALKLNPKNYRSYERRADVYFDKRDWENAIQDYTATLQLKPDDANAHLGRGNAYRAKDDYDRAINDLNEAIRLAPNNALALDSRGAVFVAMKDYERAVADLGEAIRLSPNFPDPYVQRASAYLGEGDTTRALADAEEAIRLDSKYPGGYEARGEVKERSGDYRGALDDFEQTLASGDNAFAAKARASRDRVLAALASPGGSQGPAAPIAAAALGAPERAPEALPPIGRRVALVIGNGAYHDAPLANPEVDADLVAASLEKTGFAVTVKKDLGLDMLEQAVDDFADSAKGAEVALFYFAGHGFSIAAGGRQQNLLMATDADFHARTGLGLERGGEPLEHVEETIIGHARATLIFVDACRDVPALASRGVGSRGFAPFDVSAFDGAFVVISTRSGGTAADGVAGQGSPFARAFASILPTPRLRIEDAYARIREKVRAETSGEEVPDVIRSDLPEGGVVLARDLTNDH
jgi:tetratricopeptide (TPR) repeat protein